MRWSVLSYGRPSPDRTAQRNGYRQRPLDTRVGTIEVAIPKLRTGSCFPEWLLERRKRAETALITVVADCYLAGVSTRRMDKLVKTLGINALSKSQVSRMAADLDQIVEEFHHRFGVEAGYPGPTWVLPELSGPLLVWEQVGPDFAMGRQRVE